MIKDRTETGRFNLTSGALATTVGIGAALSTTIGGILIQRFSYHLSFLGLAFVALFAFGVVWFAVSETLRDKPFAGAANEPAFKSIPQRNSWRNGNATRDEKHG
ncbi:MAG: MFS transporter [Candidatus Acidiferrum sp.]